MIENFGVKNFFSFREGIDITFSLNSNCPIKVSNGKTISNVLCFKGANGSGKTNALKILPLFGKFCEDSFNYKPEDMINIEPFLRNNNPTEFYIEFYVNKVKFRYEIMLTKKEILKEKLFRIIDRSSLLIERRKNKIIVCIHEFQELKIIKLRSNASLISTAHQYEISSLSAIYNFFRSFISNVYYYGLKEKRLNLSNVSEYYNKKSKAFIFMKSIITKCDLGISNITIDKRTNEEGKDVFFPMFHHKNDERTYLLTFLDQSSGTRKLYLDLVYYYFAINMGSILIMDEFDINFHPHILPRLLDLFINSKSNPRNAQLIFTTHNAKIMDFMSKYRTYLINKDDNESFGYRLDEIPGDILRNDRLISPIYNDRKIGGVPRYE